MVRLGALPLVGVAALRRDRGPRAGPLAPGRPRTCGAPGHHRHRGQRLDEFSSIHPLPPGGSPKFPTNMNASSTASAGRSSRQPSGSIVQSMGSLHCFDSQCITPSYTRSDWISWESRGIARRRTGVSPRGAGRLSEKSPAGYPPPHHRDDTPGSAGVPPASSPVAYRSISLRCGSQPPCRREPHRPGRSKAMAPLPVDPVGGDGRGCGRLGAGGTPALPGGLHPMMSLHQGDKIAEAFGRRSSLNQVHLSSCLFVFIRGSSS